MLDEFSGVSLPASLPISEHPDALELKEHGYGEGTKPQAYLDAFTAWLQANLNQLPALIVVTQRPRELTRADLKAVRLALDEAGYSEVALRIAWRDLRNQDIAASIVGFIRARALGTPLLPYAECVQHALQSILASRAWTSPQRQWLEKIANQIKTETIVDREALDHGLFQNSGGFPRLNKIFDGQVAEILTDFHARIWQDAA
jgi:type I restriction enzyme R subunit